MYVLELLMTALLESIDVFIKMTIYNWLQFSMHMMPEYLGPCQIHEYCWGKPVLCTAVIYWLYSY